MARKEKDATPWNEKERTWNEKERTWTAEARCRAQHVDIWAYFLMPDHVHLIAVPQSAGGLGRSVGEAHRRYTRMVNFREGWRGHPWQGTFASFTLDEHGTAG